MGWVLGWGGGGAAYGVVCAEVVGGRSFDHGLGWRVGVGWSRGCCVSSWRGVTFVAVRIFIFSLSSGLGRTRGIAQGGWGGGAGGRI